MIQLHTPTKKLMKRAAWVEKRGRAPFPSLARNAESQASAFLVILQLQQSDQPVHGRDGPVSSLIKASGLQNIHLIRWIVVMLLARFRLEPLEPICTNDVKPTILVVVTETVVSVSSEIHSHCFSFSG